MGEADNFQLKVVSNFSGFLFFERRRHLPIPAKTKKNFA